MIRAYFWYTDATMPPLPVHPVQHHILNQLRTASTPLRYGQLRLPHIENDLFNYHLRQLVRNGYVAKLTDGYSLSREGKAYLVDLNPIDSRGLPQRIKVAAMCLVVDNTGPAPRLLYQLRSRQPLASQLQLIGGGLIRGEAPLMAARRRLHEEAGLDATFQLAGFWRYWRTDAAGDLYSDILFHVCVAFNPAGQLSGPNEFGEPRWLALNEAVELETQRAGNDAGFARLLPDLVQPEFATPLFYLELHNQTDLN